MSVITSFKQIRPFLLEKILKNEFLIEDYMYSAEKDSPTDVDETIKEIDIDKAGDAIGFLLDKISPNYSVDLSQIIKSASQIRQVVGYDFVHFLTAVEVRSLVSILREIKDEDLLAGYDAEVMNAIPIYPGGWDDNTTSYADGSVKDDKAYILQHFRLLVSYYEDAALENNAILICKM